MTSWTWKKKSRLLPKIVSIHMLWPQPTLGNLHYDLITWAFFLFFMHDKPISALWFHYCSSLCLQCSPPRFLHGWLSFLHSYSCFNSNLTSSRGPFPNILSMISPSTPITSSFLYGSYHNLQLNYALCHSLAYSVSSLQNGTCSP